MTAEGTADEGTVGEVTANERLHAYESDLDERVPGWRDAPYSSLTVDELEAWLPSLMQ